MSVSETGPAAAPDLTPGRPVSPPAGDRPLPLPDADSRPYWQAAREGRLLIQRCRDCGRAVFYPRSICPQCMSDRIEWVKASGRGTVYSYTVVWRAPEPFAAEAPYVVALVDLDEGVRMMARVTGCPREQVRIGMPVRVDFQTVNAEIALPVFRPA